jgi:hypothetical protein
VSFRRWRAVRRCGVAHGRVPKGGRGPQDDENGDQLFTVVLRPFHRRHPAEIVPPQTGHQSLVSGTFRRLPCLRHKGGALLLTAGLRQLGAPQGESGEIPGGPRINEGKEA